MTKQMNRYPKKLNLAWIVFCFTLFLPPPLSADESGPVIMIVSRANAWAAQRAINAVDGQLNDLPLRLAVKWVSRLEPNLHSQLKLAEETVELLGATAVFWVDLSVPNHIIFYFVKAKGEQILVRPIGPESGSEEGQLETLAIIARNSVKAVLEGGEIGISAPVVDKEDSQNKPLGLLEIVVSYSASPFSGVDTWLHGPRLGLSAAIGKWARFFIAYRIMMPVQIDSDLLSLEFSSHPFEIGTVVRWRKKSWALDIGLAFLVDVVTARVTPTDKRVEPRKIDEQWLTGISPFFAVGWSPSPYAMFFFSAALDITFNQSEYVIEDNSSTRNDFRVVVAPWNVRPFLQLGVAFALL